MFPIAEPALLILAALAAQSNPAPTASPPDVTTPPDPCAARAAGYPCCVWSTGHQNARHQPLPSAPEPQADGAVRRG